MLRAIAIHGPGYASLLRRPNAPFPPNVTNSCSAIVQDATANDFCHARLKRALRLLSQSNQFDFPRLVVTEHLEQILGPEYWDQTYHNALVCLPHS